MLSIPNLAPICRNLNSPIESFKYGKFQVPKTYLGPCIRHYETWNSLRAPNYEAFMKILINLRTRSFSSDNLPQKLVKAGAAIKWRGYWSEFSLCKCCSSSTLPRQQRRHYFRIGSSATVLLWTCGLNRQLQCATKHYCRIKVPPFINPPKTP